MTLKLVSTEKKINIVIALDREKAFDTVHRERILVETKRIGITRQCLMIYRSS